MQFKVRVSNTMRARFPKSRIETLVRESHDQPRGQTIIVPVQSSQKSEASTWNHGHCRGTEPPSHVQDPALLYDKESEASRLYVPLETSPSATESYYPLARGTVLIEAH